MMISPNRARVSFGVMLGFVVVLISTGTAVAADSWQAGAAKVVITPSQLMWMSGYGSRDHAAEGKLHDLWAKALVIEDPTGERLLLITLDLVGVDRELSLAVRDALAKQHKLEKRQIAICCSHTHTGPVVGRNLRAMYFLDDTQSKLVDKYTDELQTKVLAVAAEAISKLAPAEFSWANSKATFAVNRRTNVEADVPRLIAEGALKGPVDHDVPVLAVRDKQGQLKSIVCGYACHATVLSFFQWSGDWPGFAQIELEKSHPGAIALFWAGCGADQNPLPRRDVTLAEKYGKQMAAAVEQALAGKMTPIAERLAASYAEIDLPLATLPTTEELQKQAESKDKFFASRAKLLLAQVAGGKPLSQTYPYPIQCWRLGDGPVWITLGGEVVVDFSLRLKHELGANRTWVAGYTNDVMAYIPSRRVLNEGGYEGASAMVYYGLPTTWAPEIEERIVNEVKRQTAEVNVAK